MATQATTVKGSISGVAGSATTVELIAAVAGKTLAISSLFFTTTTATTIVLKSGTTALTAAMLTTVGGQFRFTAADGLALASGEALNLTSTAAITVSGLYVGTQETA